MIECDITNNPRVKDRLAKVYKGFVNPFGPQRTCEKCKNKRSDIIVPLYDSITDKRYVLCRYCAEDLCEELAKEALGRE